MAERKACANCGAPKEQGYAACKFCKTPFVENPAEAIPCPNCATLNDWGAQKCVACHAWVVVQCVFCSSLTPHHLPACLNCHEVFAGAPERLRQRQESQSHARNMQVVSTVGTVAVSLLGAAAGAAVFGDHERHAYRQDA